MIMKDLQMSGSFINYHFQKMGIAKLKNRFPPQERSSNICSAGRTLRRVLIGFGLFFFLSIGVAIGYVSHMNANTFGGGNR